MLLYFYIYIGVTLLSILLSTKVNKTIFRADIFITLSLFLYAIPVPFNYIYLKGDSVQGLSYENCSKILSFNLLFLVFFLIGYYMYNIFKPPKSKFLDYSVDNKTLSPDFLIYVSLSFSLILLYGLFQQFGGITEYFSLSRFDLYKEKRDNNLGVFTVGFDFLKALIVLLLAKVLFIRKERSKEYGKLKMFAILLLSLLFIFIVLGSGDRRPIVGLLIGLSFIGSFYGKINEKLIMFLGIPFALIMQLLSYLRHLINSPEKMLVHLQSNYTPDWLDISKGELGNCYLIFNNLLTKPEKWDFFWGSTYLYNLTNLFPKAILPIRYEGIAIWFVSVFYPETYAKGGGYGFNIVAEGFINFGVPGIAITGFMIGIIANSLWNFLCINNTNPLKLTLYAMLLTIFFIFGRTDSGGLMKEFFNGTFLPIVSIFLLNYIIKLRAPKPEQIKN